MTDDDTSERNNSPNLTRRATLSAAVGTPALLGLAIGSYEAAARRGDSTDYDTGLLCPLASGQSSLEDSATALSADPRLLSEHDLSEGQQVRLERTDEEFAVYTVAEERPENPTDVIRASAAARCRLDLVSAKPPVSARECPSPDSNCSIADEAVDVTVSTIVPNPDLSESEARNRGELIEQLDVRGSDTIFLAPHGGGVQPWSDDQAEHAAELTESTCWRAKGWGPDGGNAFNRWYVPSYEISPASYPELETIADETYDLAVDFSGVCDVGVEVGGTARASLREAVRDSINGALPGYSAEATLSDGEGTGERMLVNRLGEESIYIAQSYDSRRAHWEEVAYGVAAVLSDDIEESEQPPSDRGNRPDEQPPSDRGNRPDEQPPSDRGNRE